MHTMHTLKCRKHLNCKGKKLLLCGQSSFKSIKQSKIAYSLRCTQTSRNFFFLAKHFAQSFWCLCRSVGFLHFLPHLARKFLSCTQKCCCKYPLVLNCFSHASQVNLSSVWTCWCCDNAFFVVKLLSQFSCLHGNSPILVCIFS